MILPEDFVYVIESGKIVEKGVREELEKLRGGYVQKMTNSKTRPLSEMSSDISIFSEYNEHEGNTRPSTPSEQRHSVDMSTSFLDMRSSPVDDLTFWKESAKRFSFWGEPFTLSRRSKRLSSSLFIIAQKKISSNKTYRRMSMGTILAVEKAAHTASSRRDNYPFSRQSPFVDIPIDDSQVLHEKMNRKKKREFSYYKFIKNIYCAIPNKLLLYVGIVFCVAVGALPPAFSSLLARLIGGISTNATKGQFLQLSLLMVLIAILDGCSQFLKFSLMQCVASAWISSLRVKSFTCVMRQDKAFFDKPVNGVNNLVNCLVKDSLDAMNLIGLIAGQVVSIITILLVGPIWALIVGWQLSFIGFALIPVFIAVTLFHAQVAVKLESENKILRENLARQFHQVYSNFYHIIVILQKTNFCNFFLFF